MNWSSFFLGALVGWLVELLIDVFFWRRRYQGSAAEARLRIEMAGVEAEYSQLEAQLVGCQEDFAQSRERSEAQAEALSTCDLALERANAQVVALKQKVVDLQTALSDAEARVPAAQVSTGADIPQRSGSAPQIVAPVEPDDLTKIEGVGPKIAGLLVKSGIRTFSELAAADVARLQAVLDEAGSRYRLADPSSWPEQAALAADGAWDALAALHSDLKGGRHTPV